QGKDLVDSAGILFRAVTNEPRVATEQWLAFLGELGSIFAGNLAVTPGAVVLRNELLELIQYAPTTAAVRKRPLLMTPPQINKYYALDLSPDKSMVRFLVESGIQTFAISWRNPTAAHRDWGLDTYVAA